MSQDPPAIPFAIEIDDDVRAFVDAARQVDAEFQWRWQAIIDLLEVGGHKIGRQVAGGPIAKVEHFKLGNWGIKVVWQFEQNVVRIRAAWFP